MSEENKKYDIWGNEIIDDSPFQDTIEDTVEDTVQDITAGAENRYDSSTEAQEPSAEEISEEPESEEEFTRQTAQQETSSPVYSENFYHFSSGPDNNPPEKPKKKKSHKGWVIGGICGVLFLAVVGTGVFLFTQYVEKKFDYYTSEIERAEEAAAAETAVAKQNGLTKGELTATSEVTGSQAAVLDVSGVVDQVMPSVVSLTVNLEYQSSNFFYGNSTKSSAASGSGVIIGQNDDELLIVTNNHVIDEEQQTYYYTVNTTAMVVTFCDSSKAEAYVKGTDPEKDLAVIAISMSDLSDETKNAISVAKIGDSDAAKVGNGVIAIGNALGYGQSCTVGYISALNREVSFSDGNTRTLMQVDAAINPGNSGGGLFDVYGNLIGINESKNVSQNTENMGYAIPISSVEDIITELMNAVPRTVYNDEEKGYLGIKGSDVPATYVNAGYPSGAIVLQIFEGGAAEKSNLQLQDIVTKINDVDVSSMTELMSELAYYQSGETVTLSIQRIVGNQFKEMEVEVTLGSKSSIPKDESSQSQTNGGTGSLLP